MSENSDNILISASDAAKIAFAARDKNLIQIMGEIKKAAESGKLSGTILGSDIDQREKDVLKGLGYNLEEFKVGYTLFYSISWGHSSPPVIKNLSQTA